jgi:hypothetical protein
MIVYAVDSRWPEFITGGNWAACKAQHERMRSKYTLVPVAGTGRPDTIQEIVLKIKLAVREANEGLRSIWLLRLCGHGSHGNFQFGAGMNLRNTNEWAPVWGQLRDYMTPDCRGVELFSCGLASETPITDLPLVSGKYPIVGEFRPGSVPKYFVKEKDYDKYYGNLVLMLKDPRELSAELRRARHRAGAQRTLTLSNGTKKETRLGVYWDEQDREYRQHAHETREALRLIASFFHLDDFIRVAEVSSMDFLYALSEALHAPVRAPIHAQPSGPFTELHGTTVKIHVTPDSTTYFLNERPVGLASVMGPIRH